VFHQSIAAYVLLDRKDPAGARAAALRAIAIVEHALGPDNPLRAYPELVVGKTELALGHPAAAIAPIERALALTLAPEASTDPHNIANMRLFLAHARWDAPGGDRARARTLAQQALAAFEAEGDAAKGMQADVRAWLRAHP
jgi:hypothetical protein